MAAHGQTKSVVLSTGTGNLGQNAVKTGAGRLVGVFCMAPAGAIATVQIIDALTTGGTVIAVLYSSAVTGSVNAIAATGLDIYFTTGLSVLANNLGTTTGPPPTNTLTLIFE